VSKFVEEEMRLANEGVSEFVEEEMRLAKD
jgi:hypothetical protein